MKKHIKQLLLYLQKRSGDFSRRRLRNKSRLLILCYHSVIDDESPLNFRTNIAVKKSAFERQIRLLREHWNPISVEELEAAAFRGEALPDYSVMVTFDDGFRNNLTHAAPVLKKYGVPAVVFLATSHIEQSTHGNIQLLWPQEIRERIIDGAHNKIPIPKFCSTSCMFQTKPILADHIVQHCKRLSLPEQTDYLEELRQSTTLELDATWKRDLYEFLNWDQVRELEDYGFRIGAHTVSHPILTSLPEDDLFKELAESKRIIEEKTSRECALFAHPNGGAEDFDDTTIQAARDVGYRLLFNLSERRNPENFDPMSLDRFCVAGSLSSLGFEKLLIRND